MQAQITTPIIKANFGVDADLRSNFFNNLVQSGNDDWFWLPGTPGPGQFVIDTSGTAALLAGYTANPDNRKLPFYKSMRFPAYSVVNNRLLVDAYFVRDYHGDDSTIFASGSNKNGMSPADWTCPVSQSIPDKNEILDMMIHVRKAGPNITDSMWLFGGISIENTTGNRYFDFEMYQTDIYYDRASRRFYNYGPDAGHTRWQFDASGNMVAPGDIILTAEYSSSALTNVEARIWIDKADLTTVIPAGFNWTGSFDGASSSSQYGYAGIQPKTAGAFYTGLQSVNNAWAGPFSLVLGNNSVVTTYTARQFMEFSVNLTKLGLDQSQIFGGDDCLMPFRRVIVKTRASTSFTAELKDFVAPFDFFIAPRAEVETATPMICDTGSLSNLYVMNPIPTSVYEWSTPDGHFVGINTGPSVFVDTPGTYIVTQYLQSGCAPYATDTIVVGRLPDCNVLANNLFDFRGTRTADKVQLYWKVMENRLIRSFIIERSTDGRDFSPVAYLQAKPATGGITAYSMDEAIEGEMPDLFYRIRYLMSGEQEKLSPVVHLTQHLPDAGKLLRVTPNPTYGSLHLQVTAAAAEKAVLRIFDPAGRIIYQANILLQKGANTVSLSMPPGARTGMYQLVLTMQNKTSAEKILYLK